MISVLVVIPTYNESESIQSLLSRLDAARKVVSEMFSIDILLVDDSSPDKTAQIATSMNLSNFSVLNRSDKSGLGPAYLAGFKQGLNLDYQYFVEMDADLSHQPEQLVDLLKAATANSLVIGTRWMPGGSVVNWPKKRRWISKLGTRYASFALNLPYKDLTSGFRVLPRQLLEKIDFTSIETRGYGFQIEMALKAISNGFQIKQVPITFVERENGYSKMSMAIVWEAWFMVTIWGLRRLIKRR
ncbi:dolichol-phosphate mannosyltransferase [Candidatus Nanopelagicus hibericus]|uniref:Dolichol-phosphate mannosyltransferase n=1 Tax=Candidatus Nanopelagicus hibericus TaxID=1884915 RepID=A0A249K972_9ACTN|nr:polyprenol monophosphomannose synthase [Candidatus Nanopelagicus hibericus]ASY13343.1 dolichol-phosphate mannosyltransferase [Candidatus Nanopelagicus hibericus]